MQESLVRAVLALAAPADVQMTVHPDFVCHADELVCDFAESLRWHREQGSYFTPDQRTAFDTLDGYIESISGKAHLDIWIGPDALQHPAWDRIRKLAKDVATAMRWELQRPEPSRSLYFKSPE